MASSCQALRLPSRGWEVAPQREEAAATGMAQDMCPSSSADEEATESDLSCDLPAREGTTECTPARTQPGSRISAHSVFKEGESQAAANKGHLRTLNSSPELEVTQQGGAAANFGRAFHHTSPGVHAETERDHPVHEIKPGLPQRTPGMCRPPCIVKLLAAHCVGL